MMGEFLVLYLPIGLAILAAIFAIAGIWNSDPLENAGRCFWCGKEHK